MQIREGAYYRTRGGHVFGPMVWDKDPTINYPWHIVSTEPEVCWDKRGFWLVAGTSQLDLISEVYVSDTPPSDDVLLNLSGIARTKSKAMGEGNFGMDENPPCGIRLRWLVEVVDSPHDTLLNVAAPPADAPAPEAKTLRDEFAMEAMKLLIPRHERDEKETLAEFAYRQADTMMEARKK
jgi:hypothetical protein